MLRRFLNPQKKTGSFNDNKAILIGLIIIMIIVTIIQPNFLSTKNILNILRSIATTGIIAFGMTLAIIIMGIDLSQGSIIGLSACFCAWLIGPDSLGLPAGVGIFGGIAIGCITGAFNGFFLSRTSLPPFVVTLASQLIARGFCYVVTKGNMIYTKSEFGEYGNGYLFDLIPLPVVYLILIFIVMYILLAKTRFGRNVYAYGGNMEAARFSGINIKQTIWWVYLISGILSGIVGVIICSRIGQGSPATGVSMEFDGVAACYLGGISYLGGEGRMESTLLGAVLLGVVANAMTMLLVPWYVQNIVKGGIILGAVYLDCYRKQKENEVKILA
mgnify:FL=1